MCHSCAGRVTRKTPGRRRRGGRARRWISFCSRITRSTRLRFTARSTRLAISALGVRHRRGGYRDPESQAFIESWFSKLKERLIWRMEFETLEQLRHELAAYIDRYHHRPHSGLDYLTPKEVRHTWDDAQEQPLKLAA